MILTMKIENKICKIAVIKIIIQKFNWDMKIVVKWSAIPSPNMMQALADNRTNMTFRY